MIVRDEILTCCSVNRRLDEWITRDRIREKMDGAVSTSDGSTKSNGNVNGNGEFAFLFIRIEVY